MLVRVLEGTMRAEAEAPLHGATTSSTRCRRSASSRPTPRPKDELIAGEVGFVVANVKEVADAKVGDTITEARRPTAEPFPGFKEIKPMVFAGIFPVDAADYEQLKDALDKLRLNDSAFTYEPETSQALGFGFRCGYLGLLAHGDRPGAARARVQPLAHHHRAQRGLQGVHHRRARVMLIDNPAKLPPPQEIEHIEEPILTCHIHCPEEHLGAILKLCQDRRGVQKDIKYHGQKRVQVTYEMPLAEVVFDFFDRLKSVSRGYASLDYELAGYQTADLVKLDILLNGEPVDALSSSSTASAPTSAAASCARS